MKGKITFKLSKIKDTGITFIILDQDSSLREGVFTASNGLNIMATSFPLICIGPKYDTIYIRGKARKWDSEYCEVKFPSKESRDKMYDNILQAFKEFKEAGYFGKVSEESEFKDNNIFEF